MKLLNSSERIKEKFFLLFVGVGEGGGGEYLYGRIILVSDILNAKLF